MQKLSMSVNQLLLEEISAAIEIFSDVVNKQEPSEHRFWTDYAPQDKYLIIASSVQRKLWYKENEGFNLLSSTQTVIKAFYLITDLKYHVCDACYVILQNIALLHTYIITEGIG